MLYKYTISYLFKFKLKLLISMLSKLIFIETKTVMLNMRIVFNLCFLTYFVACIKIEDKLQYVSLYISIIVSNNTIKININWNLLHLNKKKCIVYF